MGSHYVTSEEPAELLVEIEQKKCEQCCLGSTTGREKFQVTREEASWPKSIGSMLSLLSGLGVHALQRCIKTYYVVLLSTIVASAGFILSAFAPSILGMTLTFGAMHGLGHGIFITSSAIYILHHFDKYQTVATSFIFIVYALSAIISQFVLARLVDTYALDGALLIYGGVLMNTTAILMLARILSLTTLCRKRTNPHFL